MRAAPTRFAATAITAIIVTAMAVAQAPAAGALSASPGTAPKLQTAAARAADLRTKVDALTTAAEVASEDYAGSQAQVADVLSQHMRAQRELDAAKDNSAQDTSIADDRVRAIYMTGGKAGMLSGILGAGDLGDLTARIQTMDSLVGADQTRIDDGLTVTGRAAALEAQLARLSSQKLALDDKSAAAAERVQTALAAAQQLLAAADASVRLLAQQDADAADAASAQDFLSRLAAARSGHLPPGSPSSVARAAIAAARTRLGSSYVWGATGPETFDCSGLTGWSYQQAGVQLARTSREQWWSGPQIGLADLTPGDLLFWATDPANPASIHHVAIYLGDGMMIAAPHTGDVVRIQAVYSRGYFGAVRPRS